MFKETFIRLFDRVRDILYPHFIPWIISIFVLSLCFYILAVLFTLFVNSHVLHLSWLTDDGATVSMRLQAATQEEVLYGNVQSSSMAERTAAISYLWWGVMGFVSNAALLILYHASRVMVLACQDALEIYSLAGATDLYNKAPFYLAGILQGSAGATLAIVFLFFSAKKFQAYLPHLLFSAFSLKNSQMTCLAGGLLLNGGVLGWAGSWLALKKGVKF